MNEKGELIIKEEEETYEEPEKQKTQYPSTKEYQPTGNFVYNPDYFEKIHRAISTCTRVDRARIGDNLLTCNTKRLY